MELMQVAQEAARQSSNITIAIPTALVSSIATILGREAIAAVVGKRRAKNGNGKPPGQAKICIDRGEKIAVMEEKHKNVEEDITEIKGDVKKLLQRIPARGNEER